MRVGALVTCPTAMVGLEYTPWIQGLVGKVTKRQGDNVWVQWTYPKGGAVTYIHFAFQLVAYTFVV